jgi:hypothetical protein
VNSVLDQWRSAKANKNNANTTKKSVKSLGETLSELKILTPEDTAEKKPVNKMSVAEKRAILSQYSYVSDALSDEEDGEESHEEDLSHFKLDSLPEDPFADTNPNRAAAKMEELAKREQMKQDHLKVSARVGVLVTRSGFDPSQKVEEKKIAREKFKSEKARKEEERKKAAVKQERRR